MWKEQSAFPYIVTTPPAVLPLAVADVKAQLNYDSAADSTIDPLMLSLIGVATDAAEKFTHRDLITRTYLTYRDHFPYRFQLRRCPNVSLTSIKYYSNGVLTTVDPTTYYMTVEPDYYPKIQPVDTQAWPSTVDFRFQCIQIAFTAGYGAAGTAVPPGILQGILQHVAHMWMNRGDFDTNNTIATPPLPEICKHLYSKFIIPEID